MLSMPFSFKYPSVSNICIQVIELVLNILALICYQSTLIFVDASVSQELLLWHVSMIMAAKTYNPGITSNGITQMVADLFGFVFLYAIVTPDHDPYIRTLFSFTSVQFLHQFCFINTSMDKIDYQHSFETSGKTDTHQRYQAVLATD